MRIFKGEDRDRMHLLPLINATQSGISIRVLLERLVALLKPEGRTKCAALCDEERYMLLSRSIESVLHIILEEIKEHKVRSLTDYIPIGIDSKEH